MKTILTLLCIILATASLFAQTGLSKQKDVQAIKSRTLIVVLEEPNEKLKEKLKDDELDIYIKDIEEYNKNIREASENYWKFNTKIEYKTRAEVEKLTKSKNREYAYIEYNKYTVNCYNAAAWRSTLGMKDTKSKHSGTFSNSDYISTILNIRLSDDNPLGPPVFGVHLASPFPNKADLVYALKAMQLQFSYKSEGKSDMDINSLFKENAKNLAKLTLLIDEDDTKVKPDVIKKVYPYPFELVKREKIEQAILNSDENIAFVMIIPYVKNDYSFNIFSAKDCVELGRTAPDQNTGVSIGGIAAIDEIKAMEKNKLQKDHFKLFAKHVK